MERSRFIASIVVCLARRSRTITKMDRARSATTMKDAQHDVYRCRSMVTRNERDSSSNGTWYSLELKPACRSHTPQFFLRTVHLGSVDACDSQPQGRCSLFIADCLTLFPLFPPPSRGGGNGFGEDLGVGWMVWDGWGRGCAD